MKFDFNSYYLSVTSVVLPKSLCEIEENNIKTGELLELLFFDKRFIDAGFDVLFDYPIAYLSKRNKSIEKAVESSKLSKTEYFDIVFMRDGIIHTVVNLTSPNDIKSESKLANQYKELNVYNIDINDSLNTQVNSLIERLLCGEGINIPSKLVPLKKLKTPINFLIKENLLSPYFYKRAYSAPLSYEHCLYTKYGESLGMVYVYSCNSSQIGCSTSIYAVKSIYTKKIEEITAFNLDISSVKYFKFDSDNSFDFNYENFNEKENLNCLKSFFGSSLKKYFTTDEYNMVENKTKLLKGYDRSEINVNPDKIENVFDYGLMVGEFYKQNLLYNSSVNPRTVLCNFITSSFKRPPVSDFDENKYDSLTLEDKLEMLVEKDYYSEILKDNVLAKYHPSIYLETLFNLFKNSYFYYLHKYLVENDKLYQQADYKLLDYIILSYNKNNFENIRAFAVDTISVYKNSLNL